jgi:hypothetical protein
VNFVTSYENILRINHAVEKYFGGDNVINPYSFPALEGTTIKHIRILRVETDAARLAEAGATPMILQAKQS